MFNNWASDERVTEYLSWLPHENITETEEICKLWEKESKQKDFYQWVIILKETNEPIGSIGVVYKNENKLAAEVGYCIGYNYWGKGYVKEALDEVLKILKKVGFVRIYAEHNILNYNSGKVMKKCGFEYEGITRKSSYNNKKVLVDMALYSIIFQENI